MSEYIISEEDGNAYTLEEGAFVAFPWRTKLPGDELPAGAVELGRAHGRDRWLDLDEGYEVDWSRGVLEEGSADWNRIKGIEARLRVPVLEQELRAVLVALEGLADAVNVDEEPELGVREVIERARRVSGDE